MNKSVSFDSSRNTVKEISQVNDLSFEEIEARWLRPSDYADIQVDYKITATKLINGYTVEENDAETKRGLECWLPRCAVRRNRLIQDAFHAVIHEQEIQRGVSVHNPERIAELYAVPATRSFDAARSYGRQDESEAKIIAGIIIPDVKKEDVNKKKSKSVKGRLKNLVKTLIVAQRVWRR
jgi:hypothetical protein